MPDKSKTTTSNGSHLIKFLIALVIVLIASLFAMGQSFKSDIDSRIERQDKKIEKNKDSIGCLRITVARIEENVKTNIRLQELTLEALGVPFVLVDSAKNKSQKGN